MTAIKMDKATEQRRSAATIAFKEKAHRIYHERNGEDAPCHNCGNIERAARGFQI